MSFELGILAIAVPAVLTSSQGRVAIPLIVPYITRWSLISIDFNLKLRSLYNPY